jgi:hypothetical protein
MRLTKRLLGWPVAASVSACAAPHQAAGPPPSASPTRRVESPGYGFEAYLWWKPEIATRDLGLIREAGFTWSRADQVVFLVTEVFTRNLIIRLDREPYWDRRDYPLDAGIAAGPPRNLAHGLHP